MTTTQHENTTARRNYELDLIAAENAYRGTFASSPQGNDVAEGPEKRTTANQYLDADADGYRIVFGFAAVGDGEPVLELVSREQDQTEITRAEWEALKAAVDASWPERIDADASGD